MHSRQLERELAEANTVSATLLTTKCRELAEVTKQRDELADALQRFVKRLQYNSIYMDGKPRCASVNRNPVKEWDKDCIFAFEILEKLKGGQP